MTISHEGAWTAMCTVRRLASSPEVREAVEILELYLRERKSGLDIPPLKFASTMATLAEMRIWAQRVMRAKPDLVIGEDYIRRWHVIPRNESCNVYLHEIMHSDDERALHDHQYDNYSVLLEGSYIEHTPDGKRTLHAGSVVKRQAADPHRLEIPDGGRAVSLFITGPRIREWGFHCPQAWRHNSEFLDPNVYGKVGRGCAE